MGNEDNRPDVKTLSELLGHTNIATTQKYLYSLMEKKMKAVSVLDDVYGAKISPENKNDLEKFLSPCNQWWRCLESNQGHYGYEPYALTI